MSGINTMIEGKLRNVRNDARVRPVIDSVKAAAPKNSDAALDVAMRASRDSFVREGKKASADDIRERAFLAAAAAATEKPMNFSDLPAGDDKVKHFFVSGVISLAVSKVADVVLPASWAHAIGTGASVTLGFFKEIYDQFFATGFNREDLAADKAGAARPFKLAVPAGGGV